VSFCTNADARGLRKVIEGCQNLRELRACELNINDMNFMSVLFKNNTVEKLYLADSIGVTDEFIRLLVEGVEPELDPFTNQSLAPPRKLSHLDLGNCKLLTDAALRHLADHIPNLTGLTLGGIASLTDAGFAILIPTVPKLTHLDVEDCLELTNATLVNLARNAAAKTLRHLQVSYCENLDDIGMMEILRKCEKLRVLEMDSTRVSDLSLAEAAQAVRGRPLGVTPSPKSSHVALRLVCFDCANITWTGIREVLSRNSEFMEKNPDRRGLIQLKCFYEYQRTVDEHTKLVLRRDIAKANLMETRWAEFMMASEEAGANRRRRRRTRDLALWDENLGWGGPRRITRGGSCSIM